MSGLATPVAGTGTGALRSLADALALFDPVQIGQLGEAALLDRFDTKFLLPSAQLPELLRRCAGRYRVLDDGGRRLFGYLTHYFDTSDLALYRAHHAGHYPRHKVRVREYVDSGARFLEVKRKANTGRTTKDRVAVDGTDVTVLRLLHTDTFRHAPALIRSGDLHEVLGVRYSRVTLVDLVAAERVTIDLALELRAGEHVAAFPGLAIVEVKQPRRSRSRALTGLRDMRWRSRALSKYCLGVTALHPTAPRNRYRRTLDRILLTLTSDATDARSV